MEATPNAQFAAVDCHDRQRLARLALVHIQGLWLVVGALAVVEAAIVVTALRMRVRSTAARSVVGSRPAEIVWTLLPVPLLAALALLSFQAG